MNLPNLNLAPLLEVTPLEYCRELQLQKNRVTWLSCDFVLVILRLAISVEQHIPR